MKPSIFIHVQHLLGVGHLKRAATLARALADGGAAVTLASGGFPAAGIDAGAARRVQLPPARAADLGFRRLLDEAGREIDEAWRTNRAQALLQAWEAARADVLIVELFPFGRRQLRFELLPLLAAAAARRPRPLIVCSVRDVLGGQRTPERQAESLALFERYFDRVLVHGDPVLIPFERSYPLAARLGGRLSYTGYVVDGTRPEDEMRGDEVLVSAGGGAVGARLLQAALDARPLSRLRERPWRIICGSNVAAPALQALRQRAGGGVAIERSRDDFFSLLCRCRLSVSQAGYNTLAEVLLARARSVVVPFAEGNEIEQSLRARCFVEHGLLEMIEPGDLSPAVLAAAIDRADARPRPAPSPAQLDGARQSAALIERWLGDR